MADNRDDPFDYRSGQALEHPLYVIAPTPRVLADGETWQPLPQSAGRWVDAGALRIGDQIWRADGSTGAVDSVEVVAVEQWMYNLTVDAAHTFFVGDGQWLVHNCGEVVLGSYKELRDAGVKDAHHIIQDAAVRDIDGYARDLGPAVGVTGPSTLKGTPHYKATRVQEKLTYGGGTYAAERRVGYRALRAAGFSPDDAKNIIKYADDFFEHIGVTADTVTRIPGNRR